METKHTPTPGPWKAEPFRVQIPTAHGLVDGPLMSYLAGNRNTEQGMTVSVASERVADHFLCAAAPDLLAALEAFLAASDQFVADTGLKHGDAITDCAEQARAVIAKARGE